ncbi:MAG: sulfotransferase [Deltaproteobacteria bacterium]|nr:MAG: sulfotransferase [Deltaproteobacteria bacterium]
MTVKYRWRTDMNWLSGVTLSQWARLLRDNRPSATYAHRVALLTVLATYNSALTRFERIRLGSDYDHVAIERPVFILGHWRSGTTWLYHLLAHDPELTAPNAFQVVNPRTFLSTEAFSSRAFRALIPNKRVQDDVPMGFHTPEEDEYAIGILSGCTPYLGRSFPDRLAHYERFLTLHDCTEPERDAFATAMVEFMRRLTVHGGTPLLLKSPAHTARVRLLLELFPDARFIHIHRDPYRVFASTRHLYDTVDWFWTLQDRDPNVDATILRQYRQMHEAWFADRELIPEGQLVELGYEQLVADPMNQLARIYAQLDLGRFEAREPLFRAYLDELGPYRANRFEPLDEATKARVQQAADPCFDAWGYPR